MNKKTKIIIAAEIFPPDIGGPASYGSKLAEELVKRGYKTRVVTYGETKQDFGFKVSYVSRKIPFLLRQIIYGVKLLFIARGAKVVYAQGPSVGPAAILVKWLRFKRVVVKYVGDQSWQQIRVKGSTVPFEEYMDSYGKKWWDVKTWWIQRWQKFSLKKADAVITPSLYLKAVLVKYLNIDHSKIMVIPNAPVVHKTSTNLQPQQKVLYLGRVENWKGIEALLEAMADLQEYKLLIAGAGSKLADYKQLAHDKKLDDEVEFVGQVSHDKLQEYFKQCFCYILGSEYEGMPHTVLEAWAHGLPVIVSDFQPTPNWSNTKKQAWCLSKAMRCSLKQLLPNYG